MDKHSTISPEGLDRAILVWMQELSPHGICATDAELRIQGWNLWMETVSGLKRKDVVGRHLFEVFPELQERRLHTYFEKALTGEISVLATGFHKYLFRFPSPIRDSRFENMLQTARVAPLIQDGVAVGTITTVEDVTEREFQTFLLRKQNERQELFSWALAHLLQSSDPESMVKRIFPRVSSHLNLDAYFNYLLDCDGEKLRLHSAGGIPDELREELAVRNAGESPCEGRGENSTFVLCDVLESNDPNATLAKKLGLQAYVCHLLQVDDKVIGTLSFGSKSRKSFNADEIECTRVVSRYVAIALERLRNMNALQKAREELSRHAESLEKKVQERTAKLQESVAELESFSYSLAHDVRAPLRHIQGYGQLLLEDCGPELPEQARTYIDSIIRSIQKLDLLTKDILAYTQVSRPTIEMVPVKLDLLLNDITLRNPALCEPGVVAIEEPLHTVVGDRVLLDQCLSNLLDNALKFVPKDTKPRIVVRTEARGNSGSDIIAAGPFRKWNRIWVEDNGIGIAPEFHSKIFDIFERLTDQTQGTGIGLAIVAKAVQRMGGRLGVESQSGKGSRFWLELPAA